MDSLHHTHFDENDDFEVPLTQTQTPTSKPLVDLNNQRPSKKPKIKTTPFSGKENIPPYYHSHNDGYEIDNCSLDFIPSTLDSDTTVQTVCSSVSELKKKNTRTYFHNSIESKLVVSRTNAFDYAESDYEVNLCDELDSSVYCPLCGVDISNLTEEHRYLHTNHCLDKNEENVRYIPFLVSLSIIITIFSQIVHQFHFYGTLLFNLVCFSLRNKSFAIARFSFFLSF